MSWSCSIFLSLAGCACVGLLWHVVLYADGITPGAALAPENKRKAIVFYCGILEMGWRLCCEESWITIAIGRTRLEHCIINGRLRPPCEHDACRVNDAVTTARSPLYILWAPPP